jgi:hypothetical protein
MNLEHIFRPVDDAGLYELWVVQYEGQATNETGQEYALAWWTSAAASIVLGDYNGDSVIDTRDHAAWSQTYGATVPPGSGADGNGDGIIDAADYTVWRDAFEAQGPSLAVPEPTAVAMALAGLLALGSRRRVG